jgi:hypothetical protein
MGKIINLKQDQLKKLLLPKLLLPVLLLVSVAGYSQCRVGKPYSMVIGEYRDPQYKLKIMKVDSSAYLIIEDKFASVIHRFGSDSLCNKTYVTLPDTLLAREVAYSYNLIYEPKSPIEWTVRLPDQILDVQLVTTTNSAGLQQPTFQWSLAKEQDQD